MIDLKVTVRTTVLIVDDDIRHIELRTHAMKMSGFTVISANSPLQAISIMNADLSRRIGVAVMDYDMPIMNGCILAEYLKARYPELKIALYSGALDIPEHEMCSVDVFVPKSRGLAVLVSKIAEFGQIETANPAVLMPEDNISVDVLN